MVVAFKERCGAPRAERVDRRNSALIAIQSHVQRPAGVQLGHMPNDDKSERFECHGPPSASKWRLI